MVEPTFQPKEIMRIKDFNERKKYSEGSGVLAAVESQIDMVLNAYGEYEEVVSESQGELSDLITKVSPSLCEDVNETDVAKQLYDSVGGINYDQRIGHYLRLYVGHVAEGDYRAKASSGGMGTWIFTELFDKGLIDGVIHVKEAKGNHSEVLFEYGISKTIDEIRDGAKTKYYPVELSGVIEEVRRTPGRYAVVGIPSFIMAIRLLARQDSVINERIVYTVGLVCGHQKSSKFSEALGWQVGIKPGDLKYVDFRRKIPGRASNDYAVELTGIKDGKEVTIVKRTSELLGQDWGQGFFKAYASDYNDDVMNITADITLGDAWLHEYIQDSEGNNIIVIRNEVMDKLISDAVKEGRLSLDPVDADTIYLSQVSHYRHTWDELPYRLYKRDKEGLWRPKKRVEASNDIQGIRRKIQDLREEISASSHRLYKEAVEKEDLNHFTTEMRKLSDRYTRLYRVIRFRNMGVVGTFKYFAGKILPIGRGQ